MLQYDNSPGPGRETHHSAQLQTQRRGDKMPLIMTDSHQGHSALPYRPAPSYFIHKNRALWQFWTAVPPPSFSPDGGPLHGEGLQLQWNSFGGAQLTKGWEPLFQGIIGCFCLYMIYLPTFCGGGPGSVYNRILYGPKWQACGDYNDIFLQLPFAWPWHHLLVCKKSDRKCSHVYLKYCRK